MKTRYLRCEACACRRRCYVKVRGFEAHGRLYRLWRCSQGHVWYVEVVGLERLNEITLQTIAPVLTETFFRDDPFLTYLRA